jgi:hypothetical protein
MTFDEVLTQVIELLQRQGRVYYGALKRRFGLKVGARRPHPSKRPSFFLPCSSHCRIPRALPLQSLRISRHAGLDAGLVRRQRASRSRNP